MLEPRELQEHMVRTSRSGMAGSLVGGMGKLHGKNYFGESGSPGLNHLDFPLGKNLLFSSTERGYGRASSCQGCVETLELSS